MKNLTLLSLFKLAIKHMLILILAALVFGVATLSYCKFIVVPQYSATGAILVTNGAIINSQPQYDDSTVYNSDIVASINFSATVIDILETNGIYHQLSDAIDNKYTYKQLASFASIKESSDRSLFINVTFTASDKEGVIKLVNKYLELAPDYINTFVPGCAASISLSDHSQKVSPNITLSTLIAAVLGAGITFVIILFIYSSNTVILGENDFKDRFDIPVIGAVPDFSKAKSGKYYKSRYGYGYGYGNSVKKGSDENG